MPRTDELYRLIYISTAVRPFTREDLRDLVDDAARRNRRRGLTGMLCYYAGDFLQIIEGPHDTLARLWETVRRDARHTWVQRLFWGPTAQRMFGPWDMGLCDIREHEGEARPEFYTIARFLSHCPGLDGDAVAAGLLAHFRSLSEGGVEVERF